MSDETDLDFDDDFDQDDDEEENPFANCALHRDGGVYHCGLVGTEECEFECPFNIQIGRKRWYTPRSLKDELIDSGGFYAGGVSAS